MDALTLRAGPVAMKHLEAHGFSLDDVRLVVGASGGPKWLTLYGLDRVLFPWIAARRVEPLHLLGSSIGSWRMACLATADPVAAVDRLERAYVEQHYEGTPTIHDVSRVSAAVLDAALGPGGVEEILSSRWARLHVLTNRSRGLLSSESRAALMGGLGMTAMGNLFSRRAMGWFLDRVVFHSPGSGDVLDRLADEIPTLNAPLTPDNLKSALLASGSIPMVLAGVAVPGGPDGLHRDGGIIDYHPAFADPGLGGLVLYPHFFPHVIPGWFDKRRRSRWARAQLDRTILLSPSEALVATFPDGRIPDRKDFYAFPEAERIRRWRVVGEASTALGEELGALLESGRMVERVRPV